MNSKDEDQICALKEKAHTALSDAELLLENGTRSTGRSMRFSRLPELRSRPRERARILILA